MPLLPFYWTAKIRFNMGMDYRNDFPTGMNFLRREMRARLRRAYTRIPANHSFLILPFNKQLNVFLWFNFLIRGNPRNSREFAFKSAFGGLTAQ
jgi:hypothetical protein